MTDSRVAFNLAEYQELARSVLASTHYDYIAGAAGDKVSLAANRAAFARWAIIPRVLRGIKEVDLSTTILGQPISLPVAFAPVGYQCLANEEGEVGGAAAARDAGTIYTLSTLATRSIEDVGRETGAWWFQLYCFADREITLNLIQRAEAAGASAILVTVDTPLLGRREADERNRFTLPEGMAMVNLSEALRGRFPAELTGSGLAAYAAAMLNSSLTWTDIEWVASRTKLPVGVKGVLAGEDAALACEHGVPLLVVSNHGGRQLDHSIATLDALPAVVKAVDGRCEVLLDGGIRRGTDVVKALALGAKAVMIGRPYVWGLSVDGRAGASSVIEMLRSELKLDMLLCGCATVADVGPELLSPV